jgi:aminoglycoside phosphotransferase (APT) family kinase protein
MAVSSMTASEQILDEAALGRLLRWLEAALGARSVEIAGSSRLSGGAIQENIGLDLVIEGGPRAGRHGTVLRRDAPSGVAESHSRLDEYALLEAAHRAGIAVAEPWCACADAGVIGRPFYLMARVPGEARGVRLLRDDGVLARGEAIVAEIGRQLARLHRLGPDTVDLPFLGRPAGSVLASRVADLRAGFDGLSAPQPVFEWGLRRLELWDPGRSGWRLIHADCRTGNYLVHEGRLMAILDWEFARFSDPLEDLGWFLARCWRFGAVERAAGGLGSRDAFLAAYEAEAGEPVDRELLRLFELFATIRWGLIAQQQADRHFSGREASLELALTEHVGPVLECDVLAYVDAIEEGRDL